MNPTSRGSVSKSIITPDSWGEGSAGSVPPIPEPLVKWLDKHFPERCPSPGDNDREIWMEAGRRDLIRLLKSHMERQSADQNVLK